jgi:hypothetical protein
MSPFGLGRELEMRSSVSEAGQQGFELGAGEVQSKGVAVSFALVKFQSKGVAV